MISMWPALILSSGASQLSIDRCTCLASDNAKLLDFTPEEWRDFNHAVSKIELQGDRYPTDQEKR